MQRQRREHELNGSSEGATVTAKKQEEKQKKPKIFTRLKRNK